MATAGTPILDISGQAPGEARPRGCSRHQAFDGLGKCPGWQPKDV